MPKELILVVDDDKDIAEIVAEFLEGEGYRTVRAHDGGEALEAIERHHPDAIVLDIKMPVMDGVQVIQRLRAHPTLASTPVVVLTATRVIDDLEKQFNRLNVHRWISKPFEAKELIRTVTTALREGR